MNIPVYNCLINENENDESGIYAMSFVDAPANEVDFVVLNHQPKKEYLNKDTHKQILTGVVLRPDQLIYRHDAQMGEYYIKFSAQQIEKIAHKMMRTGIALHNTTHQHQAPLKGNYMTELWIVEDPTNDKSRALGFSNLPKGTLMCSYKIEDSNYWNNEVMQGNVKGFSLEGLFFQETALRKHRTTLTNKNNKKNMNKNKRKSVSLMSKLAQFFLDIQAVEKSDATASGIAYVVFTLADGKEIFVDGEGFVTLDGEQLPAGDHPLAGGNVMTVDDQGQFIETKEAADQTNKPDQATAPETLSARIRRARLANEANADPNAAKDPKSDTSASGNESVDALKTKIADLESKLAELAGLAKEANTEVQKLRRSTPSTLPLSATAPNRKFSEMKRYEQMAQTLSMTIKNRR